MKNNYLDSLKKFWNFIWNDDSLTSWILNILLAFLIIKFLVFPFLGFVMGTSHPIVAVVSGSMEHKMVQSCTKYSPMHYCVEKRDLYEICGTGFNSKTRVNFDKFWQICGPWYEENDINKKAFMDYSFKNGFNTGDIIILVGTKPKNIEIGDVIVFGASQPYPIIHRVVKKTKTTTGYMFQTKGDHNNGSGFDDQNISDDRVIGRAIIRIPWLGWIKIYAFRVLELLGVFKAILYVKALFV